MTRYVSESDWLPADNVNLTVEQKHVILENEKNIAVIAGPGTGKTEVLAQKATYLLQTAICNPPFKILALCYKVSAAKNIKERVQKRCPKDLSNRFHSYTVDSFIISLVRRFATSLPSWLNIQTDFEIVANIDKNDYLQSTRVHFFPEDYTKNVSVLNGVVPEATKSLYLYAAKRNFFDYNMCHTLAYYIVANNKKIKELISKTYKYVFLDEFQDMNNRHYDILKCIFDGQSNKICAVGDYNQAIMGWAGAVPDIFNKFQKDFYSIQYFFTYNHRSSPIIVKFINKVVQKLTPPTQSIIEYKYSSVSNEKSSFIAAKGCLSREEEAVYIAICIKVILKKNPALSLDDFAIILKQESSKYLSETQQTFNKYGIQVRNEDEKVCKGGIRFQDLMVDKFSNLIIYILKLKLKNITVIEKNELLYLLSDLLSLDMDKSNNIKKIYNVIKEILEIDFCFVQEWLNQVLNILPKKKIRNKFYANQRDFNEALLSVSSLLQQCINNSKGDLCLAIEEYLGINFVKLMTTHRSKGLEFDTVFFADFRSDSWWSLARSETEKEEALRCFFVGLSRAKNRLFFTSPAVTYPKEIADILNDSQMVIKFEPSIV